MNNTLFYLRYATATVTSALAAKDFGPAGFFVSFVVFNIIWTAAEDGICAANNIRATARWKSKGKY